MKISLTQKNLPTIGYLSYEKLWRKDHDQIISYKRLDQSKINTSKLIIAIELTQVDVKKITLEKNKRRINIKRLVQAALPNTIDKLFFDYILLNETPKSQTWQLLWAPQKTIYSSADIIDVDVFCVSRMIKRVYQYHKKQILLYVAHDSVSVVVLYQHDIEYAQSAEIDSESQLSAVIRRQLLFLQNYYKAILIEISKTIFAFSDTPDLVGNVLAEFDLDVMMNVSPIGGGFSVNTWPECVLAGLEMRHAKRY